MTLSYQQAQAIAFVEKRDEELAAEMRELVANSERLVLRRLDGAYERIEKAAGRLVEKAGGAGLSRDQAISRLLRTEEGKLLYAAYEHERDLVLMAHEYAEGQAGLRAVDAAVRANAVERVQKALDEWGEPEARDLAERLAGDPAVARAFVRAEPEISSWRDLWQLYRSGEVG